jgi:hypothetical protein
MKKLALLLCLLLASYSFTQEITEQSAQEPQLDEFGNVTNNVTDKSGLKQGDWYYLDIDGNQVAQKVYVDNQCQQTSFLINNVWVDTKGLSTNAKAHKGAIKKLKKNGIELSENQQILIILGESGEFLTGELLGDWKKKEEENAISILKKYFESINIKSSAKTYLIL